LPPAANLMPQICKRVLADGRGRCGGTLRDIKHVFLLSRNRSFDVVLFWNLGRVSGFGDERVALVLPNGKSTLPSARSSQSAWPLCHFILDPQHSAQKIPSTSTHGPCSRVSWNGGTMDTGCPLNRKAEGEKSSLLDGLSHTPRGYSFPFALARCSHFAIPTHCSVMALPA